MYKRIYLTGEDELFIMTDYWTGTISIKSLSWSRALEYALINMGFISGPKMLWRKLWL